MGNHVAKNTSTCATMSPKEAAAFIQHEISTHQVRACVVSFLLHHATGYNRQ
jgi:hypothetical protein